MDETEFIIGLMRQNTDELGFIPAPSVEQQYIAAGRYILQTDNYGRQRGYMLHGKPTPGGVLTIAQACIDYDYRQRGFGQLAARTLIERAEIANVRAIKLRCADDLEANAFWLALGFDRTKIDIPNNRRQRAINTYLLDLWPTLWKVA